MAPITLTRRTFMAATGATVGAIALVGCGGGSTPTATPIDTSKAWRLSGARRRISNAAKSHNANKVFATPLAAHVGRAHPGDTSKIVPMDVNPNTWLKHFGAGDPCVDLRQIGDKL